MGQIEAQLMKIGDELARVIREVHDEILAREEDDPFRIVGYNNAGQETMYIDQAIEDAVFNYLSGLDVNGIFLAEEHGTFRIFEGQSPTENEFEVLVCLDPVDGSENLKRSIPFYSAALALGVILENACLPTFGDLKVGIVIDFASDVIIKGISGKGVSIEGSKSRFYDLDRSIRSRNIVVDGYFRVNHHQVLMKALSTSLGSFSLRNIGCVSLELVYTALRKYDLFLDLRNWLNAYDIAASSVILKEAGAHVLILPDNDYWSVPLSLDRKYSMIAGYDTQMIDSVVRALGGLDGIHSLMISTSNRRK